MSIRCSMSLTRTDYTLPPTKSAKITTPNQERYGRTAKSVCSGIVKLTRRLSVMCLMQRLIYIIPSVSIEANIICFFHVNLHSAAFLLAAQIAMRILLSFTLTFSIYFDLYKNLPCSEIIF